MSARSTILLILAVSWSASGSSHCKREECYGSWKTPEGCTGMKEDCKYQAEWCANDDEVSFTVQARTGRRRSVGIGFSKDNMTADSDTVIGGIRDDEPFVDDSYTRGNWRQSVVDKSQDIYNVSMERQGGLAIMRFTRKRETEDENDIELGCQYFLYAYGGEVRNNGIRKPQFEAVSSRICLCPIDIKPTSSLPPRQPMPTPMPMCPSNCAISSEKCKNDVNCRPLWEAYHGRCSNIIKWNGNGEPPRCSDECKYAMNNLTSVHEGMLYSCCQCNDTTCRQGKRNLKNICGVSPSESDMCNKTRSGACDDDDDDDDKGTCPSCKSNENLCKNNATCKMLLNEVEKKCKNVFEWDESARESPPTCTDECKNSLMKMRVYGYHCCSCGNITDDDNLENIRFTIECHQKRRNNVRFCVNDTMQQPMMTCEECRRPEMNRPTPCFDVMNMCMRDVRCRRMMENMERECAPVTTWNRCMRRPVCSGRCRSAIVNFLNHTIGRLWRGCDCRMPRRDDFVPMMSRNDGFESRCRRSQNNMRTFCHYDISCRDGQQHRCNWLSAVCSKDPSCKELYDDREQKCTSVFSWTENRMTPPKCTDECKEAHAKLMKHKIWKGNAACDCGNFFGGSMTRREITQREQCIRRRINMMMHCGGRFESGGCPKDPCEPETCKAVQEVCMKSTKCRELRESLIEKCVDVLNSTTNTCSDECRNATLELFNDPQGYNFRECDCGMYENGFFASPNNPKEMAEVRRCFMHQSRMREICGFNDAGQCQKCEAKKVCPRPCRRLFSRCENDTNCSMAWDNYQKSCENIRNWNTSSAIPVCSDECKQSMNDLGMNPIGRRMTCCRCENGDRKCASERRNIGLFCEVDLNNPKDCQNDQRMCNNTRDDEQRPDQETESREGGNQRESDSEEDNQNRGNIRPNPRDNDEDPRDDDEDDDEDPRDDDEDDDEDPRDDDEDDDEGPGDDDEDDNECHEDDDEGPRDENPNEECDMNERPESRNNVEQRNQFGEMMEPPTCQQWINRCREDKCCRKAYHDAHFYCKEIKEWKNDSLTAPPTCSDTCKNAYKVLLDHPIGKNIKCCKCGTFSNVDEHNFSALKVLEYCKRSRRNMDRFCNVSQENNCSRSRPTEEDRSEGVCSVGNCQELVERCQKDGMCKPLFDSYLMNCRDVVFANISSRPMCSANCKQALYQLHRNPHGSKLKCCDCGRLTTPQLIYVPSFDNLPPLGPPMRPVNTTRPRPMRPVNTTTPTGMPSMRPVNMTRPTGMPPTMMPSMMPGMPPMMDSMPPFAVHCNIARFNIERHCNVSNNDCTDCKQRVCPRSCERIHERCQNDANCSKMMERYSADCAEVRRWNGTSPKPVCTDLCKRLIHEIQAHPITAPMRCCTCDQTNRRDRMDCLRTRNNTVNVCNISLDDSDVCRRNRRECDETRRRENSVARRDQCPPRQCREWSSQICPRDPTCKKYFNEQLFYCHTVLNWLDVPNNPPPVCTRACQRAVDRLASVTKRMMGDNIYCCTCGNYTDLQDNSLRSIRGWAACNSVNANMKRFCRIDCPNCNRRTPPTPRPPMGGRPEQSCSAASRMCNNISECRRMRNRIMSACSDVIMWERDSDRRPQCTNECRRAIMAMEGSRYSRPQLCCDCDHNDMTPMQRRQCQQHRRNFEQICGMRREECNGNQNVSRNNDCFNHMERCNRDMRCQNYFFNYTDKCAKAFSGERMNRSQDNMCREAARELFSYRRFGENITRCECDSYPELCKDLFKNRFLLNRPCMEAETRCRNNTACNALLRSHTSCRVMKGSCSLSCRAKAVLLYRHRFGRNWWQLCRPHNFEQVCFTLY